MKKSLITTLVAVPLLSLSSMSFAAEPVELTVAQMDTVTAGFFDFASIRQWNASPVNTTQVNVLSVFGGNYSSVDSGNNAVIFQ